jgi:hypothetical protein
MNDRPSARELIDAVRLYLEKDLLPSLTDARQRYQALIAANVLSIAGRELDAEDAADAEEREWLEALLGEAGDVRDLNQKLCEQIRRGAFDDPQRFAEATAVVRRVVVRKLEIANPRYLQSVSAAARAPG